MDPESLLNYAFSSLKVSSSKSETMQLWTHGYNVTDEVKTILLSHESLKSLVTHLTRWDPKKPTKEIIKNLKLMLLMSDAVPELKYNTLSECGYFNEVMRIYSSCLNYLKEQNQEEIDDNCLLSLVFANISKYFRKFCLHNENYKTLSSVGKSFFEQTLVFLRSKKGFDFARNPNNSGYALTLTNTMNYLMSKQSEYKSLFIELNGIQYCLHWLSISYEDKRHFFQNLYYVLRILSILENLVDEHYFAIHKLAVITRLIKYLRCNGELILSSTFIPESCLVFECICSILIKMAMKIKDSRQDLSACHVKQLLISFLNKYRVCVKMIYTTILVLEEDIEDESELEQTDIDLIMSKFERLSNILQLSEVYRISSSNDIKFH